MELSFVKPPAPQSQRVAKSFWRNDPCSYHKSFTKPVQISVLKDCYEFCYYGLLIPWYITYNHKYNHLLRKASSNMNSRFALHLTFHFTFITCKSSFYFTAHNFHWVNKWVLKCSLRTELTEGLGRGVTQGEARMTFRNLANLSSTWNKWTKLLVYLIINV